MKRSHTAILIAASLCMAACNTQDFEYQSPDKFVKASVDQMRSLQTKALMQDNPGYSIDIFWQEGDHIGIFGEGGSNVDFVLAVSSISENGRSAMFETSGTMPKGNLTAYFPYCPDAVQKDGALVLDFPSTQEYNIKSGVVQPDPKANFMIASGSRRAGLFFQPVMAALKIGKVFDKDVEIDRVEFRDLDGKAVCGAFSTSFQNGTPATQFSGNGNIITLDCGKLVKAVKDEAKIFYLLVPARSYPKGFELCFVTSDGERITQTVGVSLGKSLQCGSVYPIGDITNYGDLEGVSSDTYPEAILLDQGKLDKIQILNKTRVELRDSENNPVYDAKGRPLQSYNLELMVHKDLNPVKDGWLVFSEQSEELPQGGVFRITSCTKANDDFYQAAAVPELNPFAPFKNLQIGKQDEEVPVNLNGFISEVVDEYGKPIDFRFNEDGQIVFGDDAIRQMTGASTKAVVNKWPSNFSLPGITINAKGDNAEASFSPQMTTSIHTAIGAFDGELQYCVLKITPTLSMQAKFSLKAGLSIGESKYLFGIRTTGIPIGGVIVYFDLEVYATVELGGQLTFSTQISCSQNLGTYSISYNKGDGFITKQLQEPTLDGFNSPDPQITGSGEIYAKGGLQLVTSMNVYGLLSIGLSTDFLMKAGITQDADDGIKEKGTVFAVGPELEIIPRIAIGCLGIKWAHNFEELTMSFNMDPWYETNLIPAGSCSSAPVYTRSREYYHFPVFDPPLLANVKTGVSSLTYDINLEGKCAQDFTVGIAIYEIPKYQLLPMSSETMAEYNTWAASGYSDPPSSTNILIDYYSLKRISFTEICEYKAGTESLQKSGEIDAPISFKSHTHYYQMIALMDKDGSIVHVFGMNRLLSPFSLDKLTYFCWPKDRNGNDYEEFVPDFD